MTDKEKVVSVFDELRHFADTDIHPIVSPDNWITYSNLRDVIDVAEENIVALLKEQEAQNECLMKKCVICPHCKNCDVDDNGLMKGQGARLLTIEEITGDGECWFEGINGAYGYADCYMCTGSKEVEVHRINMKPEYVSWDDFKKKWRCWTFRPTDEQRKKVKWE